MNPRPHERSTRMFAGLAGGFRVDVEPFDNDKWSAALTMAKSLDNLVDDDHIYDSGQYCEQVIQGATIPYMADEEADFVRSTYDRLSDYSKERWRHAATQLGAFALRRLEAEDIDTYIDVVREESSLMASVLLVENSDERGDRQQREAFNEWLYPTLRTIYTFDTCMDFIKDHNEGNTGVQLTPRTVATLARCALNEAALLICSTPMPAYPVLLRRSVTKMVEKVIQEGFWSNQLVWKKKGPSQGTS